MNTSPCPKFESCSAPICPLDQDWQLRKYLDGERVCYYLSEYAKPTRANLSKAIDTLFYQGIAEAYPEIHTRYGLLKKRLDRSALTPSRLGGEV